MTAVRQDHQRPRVAWVFLGTHMRAKYGGRCVVCGARYSANEPVLWGGPGKGCAHASCGTARGLR